MKYIFLFLPLLAMIQAASAALFTDDERTRIIAFWNAPGRYRMEARAEAKESGPWTVRMTPEASQWFSKYIRAVGITKVTPSLSPTGASPQAMVWENWMKARLAYDEYLAQSAANTANAQSGLQLLPNPAVPVPPHPGAIPLDLLATVGNPPPLAVAVAPRRYVITFDDGTEIAYTDNIRVRPRYAYYRFSQGVIHAGVPLSRVPDAELDALFGEAAMTPFEQHVVKAVSRLEGGFEAVNTYDTGHVSVGFIQFTTGAGGSGSLCAVLKHEKNRRPDDFQRDFRAYGIDVSDTGTIVVIDPNTGAELTAADAVNKIIEDKRLIAVFQLAGTKSTAFRLAQIEIAKQRYYPAAIPVKITANGFTSQGIVSDVIKSEAGMATLFDRKVNIGNINLFSDVVARVMAQHQLTDLAAAAAFEREIVQTLKYRADFLADKNLTQPQ